MAKKLKKKVPARRLRAATQKWMQGVRDKWELDTQDLMLLELAGQTWDKIFECGEDIRLHGMTYTDRLNNQKPRPTCRIQNDAISQFARLLRDLNLNLSPPEPVEKIRRRF